MKSLINILENKFLIKKNIQNISKEKYLDCKFKNLEELASACQNFFDDKLVKPIKVVKSKDAMGVAWSPTGPNTKDGVYVGDHFTIQFERTKIRVGERKAGVIFQYVYRDYRSKPVYDYMTYPKEYTYKYGKNFLTWLIELGNNDKFRQGNWDRLKKIFGIVNAKS